MKLTKYEHACFTVEKDGSVLVVDPGTLTTDFIAPEGVVAVVITHVHGDHLDHDKIAEIIDKNPDALIIGTDDAMKEIEVFETRSVNGGDSVSVGPFDLQFFGEDHALIHSSIPLARNVGVLINELIYFPGDSLVVPSVGVDTLAIPDGGPWLKVGDAIDFLLEVKPRFAFPTHDAVLSYYGKNFMDNLLNNAAKSAGIEYKRIDGETIEI